MKQKANSEEYFSKDTTAYMLEINGINVGKKSQLLRTFRPNPGGKFLEPNYIKIDILKGKI